MCELSQRTPVYTWLTILGSCTHSIVFVWFICCKYSVFSEMDFSSSWAPKQKKCQDQGFSMAQNGLGYHLRVFRGWWITKIVLEYKNKLSNLCNCLSQVCIAVSSNSRFQSEYFFRVIFKCKWRKLDVCWLGMFKQGCSQLLFPDKLTWLQHLF